MPKSLQIQLPKPCHEDWDKMNPVEQGRFCNSCQKAVVDFTGMSDAQLVAFFKKPSTGSICGRFDNDQLARDLIIPGKRMPWLKYFLQLTIPIFLTSLKAQSQGEPILKQNITPRTSVCAKELQGTVGFISFTGSNLIQGRVVDEKGNGVPFASISINETNKGTACDSAGFFEIDIPFDRKKINLMASSVGYSPTQKQVKTRKDEMIEIILSPNNFLNDEVIVTSTVCTRKGQVTLGAMSMTRETTLLQKVKNFFVGDSSLDVYPNPVKTGTSITIKWKKLENGEFNIELYNLQGQLIKSSMIKVVEEITNLSFDIPRTTPGGYLLRLTNKKSGKSRTGKIIIQ